MLLNFKKLIFILAIPILLFAQEIQYTLSIKEPSTHTATVTMLVPTENCDSLTFAMPAWAPGRYVIYNFSKNIFNIKALDLSGKPLPVTLIDKQTWRVKCPDCRKIQFKYNVYANTLDGTFSKITQPGASINGAGIFMYIKNRKDRPVKLTVFKPDAWQIISAMEQNKQGEFIAENYDILIDSPIEMGELFVYDFEHLGKQHQMVFHQPVEERVLQPFITDVKKVIEQQAAIFGKQLPYKRYVFFYHLNRDLEHTDGMEHLNSNRILLLMDINEINTDANTDYDYDNLIWLTAHEFFHVWNIKRLRPQGLGPFDYTKEVYTPCLWIVEGFTSYYAYLALIRSGIYTKEKLYSEFSGRITRYETDPGKNARTLSEVSKLTWLFKGNIPEYEETNIARTTYSYYYKGLIVGMLLDLKIREMTDNKKTLDDLMKKMYQEFYLSKPESYYLTGKGYTEEDFEQQAIQIAGDELKEFFENTIHKVAELDYSILLNAGLKLQQNRNSNEFELIPVENQSKEQRIMNKSWLEQ